MKYDPVCVWVSTERYSVFQVYYSQAGQMQQVPVLYSTSPTQPATLPDSQGQVVAPGNQQQQPGGQYLPPNMTYQMPGFQQMTVQAVEYTQTSYGGQLGPGQTYSEGPQSQQQQPQQQQQTNQAVAPQGDMIGVGQTGYPQPQQQAMPCSLGYGSYIPVQQVYSSSGGGTMTLTYGASQGVTASVPQGSTYRPKTPPSQVASGPVPGLGQTVCSVAYTGPQYLSFTYPQQQAQQQTQQQQQQQQQQAQQQAPLPGPTPLSQGVTAMHRGPTPQMWPFNMQLSGAQQSATAGQGYSVVRAMGMPGTMRGPSPPQGVGSLGTGHKPELNPLENGRDSGSDSSSSQGPKVLPSVLPVRPPYHNMTTGGLGRLGKRYRSKAEDICRNKNYFFQIYGTMLKQYLLLIAGSQLARQVA